MRNLYLICLSDEQAAKMELMLGGRIEIRPSAGHLDEVQHDPSRAVIASLDAVGFDGELAAVADRLASSGPRYHHGGPQSGRRHWPQAPQGPEPPYIQEEGGGIDLRNLTRPQSIEYEPQPALVTCCPGGEPYYTDTRHHADGSRCRHREG